MPNDHILQPATLQEAQAMLVQQQQELERLHRAHEAWMRVVAHDLRAPLRHVTSFAPLLREAVEDLAAEAPQAAEAVADAREFVTMMDQSARRMSAMLEGMAQVSRAMRAALHLEVVDWGRCCSPCSSNTRVCSGQWRCSQHSSWPMCTG